MSHDPRQKPDIRAGLLLLLAVACGLIVANLYYAQTLIGPIAAATGLSPKSAGLVVTLTQLGYTLGLIFIVPLGDLPENRRLVVTLLLITSLGLVAAACATSGWLFLSAALLIGIGSVAAQVLVPFAAHLSRPETRGQSVGKVVSGLLLGIMLARPAASLIADHGGWHLVFGMAAGIMVLLAMVLLKKLPRRQPGATVAYGSLILSMWTLLKTEPLLHRRAVYHAALFASFSLFWTVAPLQLASPSFALSQTGIAIFALVGMAGAVASPVAGKLADKGHTLHATAAALALGITGFALPLLVPGAREVALATLVLASIVLDMGVAANLVLSQRAIFALGEEARSRLNGIFFALFFAGGAVGSALGGWMFASYGWQGALLTGLLFPSLALLYWLVEFVGHRHAIAAPAA